MPVSQHRRLITLSTPLGPDAFVVTAFRGMYSPTRAGVFQTPTTIAGRIPPAAIRRVMASSTPHSSPVYECFG